KRTSSSCSTNGGNRLVSRHVYCVVERWRVAMRKISLRFGRGFKVVLGNRRAQAATMTIAPGDCEGGPDNRHRGADQWLFVVSGSGVATLAGRTHHFECHYTLLIA